MLYFPLLYVIELEKYTKLKVLQVHIRQKFNFNFSNFMTNKFVNLKNKVKLVENVLDRKLKIQRFIGQYFEISYHETQIKNFEIYQIYIFFKYT